MTGKQKPVARAKKARLKTGSDFQVGTRKSTIHVKTVEISMPTKKRKLLATIKGPAAAAIIQALRNEDYILWQPVESASGEPELEVWEDI